MFENFRYTNEWRDGRTTILFFEANVGNRELQGIDILEENEDGQIVAFTVMIRPLSGLQAVSATMAARLGIGVAAAILAPFADVAQLARASACHAEGRGFESHHPLVVVTSVGRTVRAVRLAATDQRIPRPLRLAALGLLPIPGPVDEAVLLLVAIPLGLFYRRPLREAWERAGKDSPT